MKKVLTILFALTLLVTAVSAFEIENPIQNQTYNSTNISLDIVSNESYNNISYVLNDEDKVLLCENCSNHSSFIEAIQGNNILNITGFKENESVSKLVNFTVEIEEEVNETTDFSFHILLPENIIYNTSQIPVTIAANKTLDKIEVITNNLSLECDNCSQLSDTINLSNGNYTITAIGYLDNITKNISKTFVVEVEEEMPETNFTQGFQHLPREFERGELSDEELATIIRNNELNPGIINRLIKTGMLENESINAILETQFNPPGIFRRLASFFRIQHQTYASLIYENYELSEEAQNKLLVREDLPKTKQNELRERVRERPTPSNSPLVQNNESEGKVVPPGQQNRADQQPSVEKQNSVDKDNKGRGPLNVGRQNGFVPPGQANRN
ncbi:MAG: hypothetical protein ACMXX9_00970 [Candidatus Woesearchaeota archaeon]